MEQTSTNKPKRKKDTWQQFHEGLRAWEKDNGITRDDRQRNQWGYGRIGPRKGAQQRR